VPEAYLQSKAEEALELLGQPKTGPLSCVYCGAPAATWDHLHNTVRKGRFSGYGHRIFNLVPACRTCNERKGGKNWQTFFKTIETSDRQERIARLEAFSARAEEEQFSWDQICREFPAQAAQYDELITRLRNLLAEGDRVAIEIRDSVQANLSDPKRMQPDDSE
jgi:hypothetical protein